jgi:uncharacterized delta-60 repeat protein
MRCTRVAFATALLLTALAGSAAASDGLLDPGFGNDGVGLVGVMDAVSAPPMGLAVQADGRLLVCGARPDSPFPPTFLVARFTAQGILDVSFGQLGRVEIPVGATGSRCHGVAVMADGRIVVAGEAWGEQSAMQFGVARLTPDGFLDPSFGNGTGIVVHGFDSMPASQALGLVVRADGRIVVAGTVYRGPDLGEMGLLQLAADGSPDEGFNGTGEVLADFRSAGYRSSSALSVALDAQGRLVAAGSTRSIAGNMDFAAMRVLPDGRRDPAFGAAGHLVTGFEGNTGQTLDTATAVLLQRDGKLVLGGVVDGGGAGPNGAGIDMGVARFDADGHLDATFGEGGKTTVALDLVETETGIHVGADNLTAMVEDSAGRLVLAGGSQARDGVSSMVATAVRLLGDGALDPAFGVEGKQTYELGLSDVGSQFFTGVALQGGRLVFGGVARRGTSGGKDLFVARTSRDTIFAAGFE